MDKTRTWSSTLVGSSCDAWIKRVIREDSYLEIPNGVHGIQK